MRRLNLWIFGLCVSLAATPVGAQTFTLDQADRANQ
jgi:hypothetical protein